MGVGGWEMGARLLSRSEPARMPTADPGPLPPADAPESRPGGWPLYVRVLLAALAAIPVGLALGADASWARRLPGPALRALGVLAVALDLAPRLIIRGLGALAAPLVVLAILAAVVTNDIRGRQGLRMMAYYLLNTLVAMTLGLAFSNLIRPGRGADLAGTAAGAGRARLIHVLLPPSADAGAAPAPKTLVDVLTELVPRSLGEALAQNNLAQLVLVTVAVAIALVQMRRSQEARGESSFRAAVDLVTVGFEMMMRVLLWVVALVPLAVFGVVATSIARGGFAPFLDLGWFILVVLLGLACQVAWYLVEIGVLAGMAPGRFLASVGDVVAGTFSTSSTAATIPLTLEALTMKLGVSRASSQLAACVGTNFNNDGTALYQASAALFFAQALGGDLPLAAQVAVMLATLVASVGAGGIPSGSFVVMPLIFAAVGLPADRLPILLTIDWFLDRCRTTANVLGDMTVAVLLDRTADQGPPASSRR